MDFRIFLQISEYNFEKYEYCKSRTKIDFPAQYYMYFQDKNADVVYILVSIKLHIGNDMDCVHYVCDILYYNTGTWWNCDDSTITKYSGYLDNVHDNS